MLAITLWINYKDINISNSAKSFIFLVSLFNRFTDLKTYKVCRQS